MTWRYIVLGVSVGETLVVSMDSGPIAEEILGKLKADTVVLRIDGISLTEPLEITADE